MKLSRRFKEYLVERLVGIEQFDYILKMVKGFSSANVLAALSAAVKATDGDYLEIGVMNGLTMSGAICGNERRRFVGVDNFSEFGGSHTLFLENIGRLYSRARLEFHELDYRLFFKQCKELYRDRVSVYFYDGAHEYEHQISALKLFEDSGMARGAVLVLVDDYGWDGPRRAVGDFLSGRPGWELIFAVEDDWNQKGWWNGLAVLCREAV